MVDEILLPIFPLEHVLLPQEPLHLHIFEERYKQMIGECLEAQSGSPGQSEFGVVLAKDEDMSGIGSTAEIVRVLHKYDDGRMDILTVGRRRFEVLYTNEELPYLRGGVEFFDDDTGADVPHEADARQALAQFREMVSRFDKSGKTVFEFSRPYRHLSFQLAGALPFELDFKQQLLTIRNEHERLREVSRALGKMIVDFDFRREVRKKVGGNGHLRPQN